MNAQKLKRCRSSPPVLFHARRQNLNMQMNDANLRTISDIDTKNVKNLCALALVDNSSYFCRMGNKPTNSAKSKPRAKLGRPLKYGWPTMKKGDTLVVDVGDRKASTVRTSVFISGTAWAKRNGKSWKFKSRVDGSNVQMTRTA